MQLIIQLDVIEIKDVIPLYRLRLTTISDGIVKLFDHGKLHSTPDDAVDLMSEVMSKIKIGLDGEYYYHDFHPIEIPGGCTKPFHPDEISLEFSEG